MKAVSIVAGSRHSNQNLNYSNCNDSVSSHRYTKKIIRHVLLLYCACSSSSNSEESENSKSNRPLLFDANVPTAYLKCILGPLLFFLHSTPPPSLPRSRLGIFDHPTRPCVSVSLSISIPFLVFVFNSTDPFALHARLRSASPRANRKHTVRSRSSRYPADTSRRRGTKP